MKKATSSLAHSRSYAEIGSYRDVHELSNYRTDTRKAAFNIAIAAEITYYAVDKNLSDAIKR